jgi:hypothetical protein
MASIQDGQKAASSLSKYRADARSPGQYERRKFAEILNELHARCDKSKLMDLFGH